MPTFIVAILNDYRSAVLPIELVQADDPAEAARKACERLGWVVSEDPILTASKQGWQGTAYGKFGASIEVEVQEVAR